MRVPRIYHPEQLTVNGNYTLSEDASGHVSRVLRLPTGAELKLFCGDNHCYPAQITKSAKNKVDVIVTDKRLENRESPLYLRLAQGISRGDKMEFTIQKAVELGVAEITPLFTERCGVKLSGERLQKKLRQWQKIIISACEQCGRNRLPQLNDAITFTQWLSEDDSELKLNLHPRADKSIAQLADVDGKISLLIGPEGGLSEQEIKQTEQHNFQEVQLGPRVLRTETAGLTAISALQTRFGDLI